METLSKNKIKWIRSLHLKKNRDSENCFIVEGEKMVAEILKEQIERVVCYVSTEPKSTNLRDTYLCDEKSMSQISQLKTASTHLVVVRKPTLTVSNPKVTLVVDGVQDPGNMGTIIRTADWFGIDNIVCSNETVDVFNPKVIQSTMGSIFRIPITYVDLKTFLSAAKRPVYGALLDGKPIDTTVFEEDAILVVGNEGKGITAELANKIEHPVLIPGFGAAESLNVSVATGILLYHYRSSLTS